MVVNAKVDSWCTLLDLPGLRTTSQTAWKFRLLQFRGQSLALSALSQWAQVFPDDFDSIMLRIRLVATTRKPPLAPWVERVSEQDIYAIPAPSRLRGLLYFYDRPRECAICTNDFSAAGHDPAIATAETIQRLYFSNILPPLSS